MNSRIFRILEKLLFRVIDYLLRRTTLNYLLRFLAGVTIGAAVGYSNYDQANEFFDELQADVNSKLFYYLIGLVQVIFVKGGLLVLIMSILLFLFVWYLKYTEISKAHSGEKFKQIQEGLEEKLELTNQSLTVALTDAEKKEKEKDEYQKLLNKVSYTLQVKNISKADILAKFNKRLRIIVLHKNIENSVEHIIRDEFYPHIGAVHIHGGTCVIPPNRIDQKKSDQEMLEWFKVELDNFISEDYMYNLSLIAVVDLRSIVTYHNGTEFSRYKKTYHDALEIDEILTLREIETFLYTEKNISSREIIDIPSLVFLTDKSEVPLTVYNNIEKHNREIVKSLEQNLGLENIKTTDLATVNNNDLKTAIEEHLDDSSGAEQSITDNAKFWSDYFARKD